MTDLRDTSWDSNANGSQETLSIFSVKGGFWCIGRHTAHTQKAVHPSVNRV